MRSYSTSTLVIILQRFNTYVIGRWDWTKKCNGIRSNFEFEREERKVSNPAGVKYFYESSLFIYCPMKWDYDNMEHTPVYKTINRKYFYYTK